MKCKGKELKEITEPQIFNPPRWMFVSLAKNCDNPYKYKVLAIVQNGEGHRIVISENSKGDIERWAYCAEIPEEEPKLATYRELAKWLAQGNGELRIDMKGTAVISYMCYALNSASKSVPPNYVVRKWEDDTWNKPTREYLGLEDK